MVELVHDDKIIVIRIQLLKELLGIHRLYADEQIELECGLTQMDIAGSSNRMVLWEQEANSMVHPIA